MLTLLEEKQKSLEQNLQAVKLEQQMLKVLCKDSTSVYRVDLMNDRAEIVKIEESTPTPRATCSRTGHYEEIASERRMHRLTGHSGKASIHMSAASKQSIVPEYLPYVEPFFDVSTFAERLRRAARTRQSPSSSRACRTISARR